MEISSVQRTIETEVLVVGGGLFGSIAAKALRDKGQQVIVIDADENWRGSGPAACLIKPSWVSGLGREVVDPAMAKLRELYQVQDIDFRVGPVHQRVHWIDPASILGVHLHERVFSLDTEGNVKGLINNYHAEHVVLAAGMWTDGLLPEGCAKTGTTGRAGAAFLFPDAEIEEPFIHPWAPYRQLVAFNRGDGLWVGDGTAIKPENLTDERIELSHQRCFKAVFDKAQGDLGRCIELYGIRPYVPDVKPCYFQRESDHLTVITGGAKNGTLAAGWCAHRLTENM